MSVLQSDPVDALRRVFSTASFLSPRRANPQGQYTRRSDFSCTLASPYGPRFDARSTGLLLKKVVSYFSFSLALIGQALEQSSDSALAFPGT